MLNLTKKKLIIAAVAVALVLAVAIPCVAYALPVSDSYIASSKTLVAKGIAVEVVNGKNVRVPANFTLMLERDGDNATMPKFIVVGGTVNVDGVTYTITSGNGAVLRGRQLILLKAQGTGPGDETVTLKLAGRYFWIGGRLYVARIAARLLTDDDSFVLLHRASIRV